MKVAVKLKSGEKIKVRKFQPYEMNRHIPFEDPGPFMVKALKSDGTFEEWEYRLEGDPPPRPPVEKELAQPGSREEAEWIVYERYVQAMAWQEKRNRAFEEYAQNVNVYILENLVKEKDLDKIELADMDAIRQACILTEVGIGDIEAALADVFPGRMLWAPDFIVSQDKEREEITSKIGYSAFVGGENEGDLSDQLEGLVRDTNQRTSDHDSGV